MYSELLENVKTRDEVNLLLTETEKILNSLYENRINAFSDTLKSGVREWVSRVVSREMEGQDKREYLEDLKKKLENLKVVKLTLGFEPTEVSLEKFSTFIKTNLGEEAIMEISYNPKVLAGAIVTYEGEYRDLSLSKLFEYETENINKMVLSLLSK